MNVRNFKYIIIINMFRSIIINLILIIIIIIIISLIFLLPTAIGYGLFLRWTATLVYIKLRTIIFNNLRFVISEIFLILIFFWLRLKKFVFSHRIYFPNFIQIHNV